MGIMCEYAPRELIMAAGGIPVCLCGGDADTIPAAETRLPSNLCPLVKSTYGYLVQHSNPFLEMADLVIAEATCDGKKKMFELMGLDVPTYLIDVPQREDPATAIPFMYAEFQKLRSFLEGRYRTRISNDGLSDAIRLMNRERRLRRALATLMQREQPPFTGRQLLDCKSIISCIPEDLAQYEAILDAHRDRPDNPAQGGDQRVRVLLTGAPIVHGAETIMDVIEGHGALVVAQENCTGLKPILDDADETDPDPIRALATKYSAIPCSIKTPNKARLEFIRRLAAEYHAEAIIDLAWHACLTYSVESFWVRLLAEQELGVPYLRIETDYSFADAERIGLRVEALVENATRRRPRTRT